MRIKNEGLLDFFQGVKRVVCLSKFKLGRYGSRFNASLTVLAYRNVQFVPHTKQNPRFKFGKILYEIQFSPLFLIIETHFYHISSPWSFGITSSFRTELTKPQSMSAWTHGWRLKDFTSLLISEYRSSCLGTGTEAGKATSSPAAWEGDTSYTCSWWW